MRLSASLLFSCSLRISEACVFSKKVHCYKQHESESIKQHLCVWCLQMAVTTFNCSWTSLVESCASLSVGQAI